MRHARPTFTLEGGGGASLSADNVIPVVVVQVPSPPPEFSQVEILLESCSGALPRGKCVSDGHSLTESEFVAAICLVRFDEHGNAWLEVGASTGTARGWKRQELEFEPQDPPIERLRAAGFVVASLVSNVPEFEEETEEAVVVSGAATVGVGAPRDERQEAVVTSSEAPAPTPVVPSVVEQKEEDRDHSERASPSPRRKRVHLGLVAQLSRALDGKSLRGGGLLRGAVGLHSWADDSWGLEGAVGFGWSAQPKNAEDLSLSFWTFEVGLAVPYEWRALHLSLRGTARGVFERVAARATDESQGTSQRLHRWMMGSAWGGTLSYPSHRRVHGLVGGELLLFNGGTGIEVDGEYVGSVPPRNFRVFLGFVYDL